MQLLNCSAPETANFKLILRRMKWVAFFMLIACLQSWSRGHSQTITISLKDAKLEKVFQLIREQTHYRFIYALEELTDTKPVTVELENATLQQTMEVCLIGQPVKWILKENQVIIKRKEDAKTATPTIIKLDIKGKVSGPGGDALAGATITVKGTNQTTTTNENGEFVLAGVQPGAILIIASLGYHPAEYLIKDGKPLTIQLKALVGELKDVKVSTGYEEVAREKTTGSFEKVNNALFNRAVTTTVLERLENIVPGLTFNKRIGTANKTNISIRGISTLSSDQRPLVILDNFPYEGDINNINPNDVESITVLKDAAAASIWGTKAGNGVIVISTKKAKFNQPVRVSLNNNITIGMKPDLNYVEQFTPAAFIDVEKFLFSKGYFDGQLSDLSFPVISPLVEILDKRRSGLISASDSAAQIAALLQNNILDDYSRLLYREAINWQHSISLTGGGQNVNYLLSVGYDRNLDTRRGNNLGRVTIRTNTIVKPVKKLELEFGGLFTDIKTENNSPGDFILAGGGKGRLFPYAKLADANGNPLPTVKDYRSPFTDTVGGGNLLDWKYRPLEELRLGDNTRKSFDLLLNFGAKYDWLPWLSTEVKYQFEKTFGSSKNFYSPETYYTRSLVNLFTPPGGTTAGSIIPPGGILDRGTTELTSHAIRGQINIIKTLGGKSDISAIIGAEIRRLNISTENSRVYGYNDKVLTYQPVNFTILYPTYFGYEIPVPNNFALGETASRYVSTYANAVYTYDRRYSLSASVRRDGSNLFGSKTNNKWQPLWSSGIGWNISKETFYQSTFVPYLKLRITHGYSGNVNNSNPAVLTLQAGFPNSQNGLPTLNINNPPNPSLRWENIAMTNFGLDFEFKKGTFSGSIEYYFKKSTDLIGRMPADVTSGFDNFVANSAELKGRGIDVNLHSNNITLGSFSWNTDWLFSYNTNKVSKYLLKLLVRDYLPASITPIEGEHAYSIISYKWAGLDPLTGDPQGYVGDQVSKNYRQILNSENPNDYVIQGPTRPLYFGAIRNTFTWKNISLSVNISYKLKYFFRKTNAIDYSALFSFWSQDGYADFVNRWQKPGDEQFTNVPSMTYPTNFRRDNFYKLSTATVERGDHIRLQDVALNYSMEKSILKKMPFTAIRFYAYVSNLGFIWRKNKAGLDPDYGTSLPVTYSFGANIDF